MKILSKTTLFAAAAATAVAGFTPAMARNRDGIDRGDVIAGALILGGIAAIASAGSNDRYDRRGRSFNNGYSSRTAVEQCVRAAERNATRYGRARITDVTSINRIQGGYEVRGRLVVADRRSWRGGYNGWDRYGNNYDRYGSNYDKGRFSCVSRFGGIQNVRVTGLRG